MMRLAIFASCAASACGLRLIPSATLGGGGAVSGIRTLKGVTVAPVAGGDPVDLGQVDSKTLLVLGTYAADFNAIEYAQRLRHYLPQLKEKGIDSFKMVLNASPEAALSLKDMLDIPDEVTLYADPSGEAGRKFGVGTGWRPDDTSLSPYLKLFGMLFGLGAWATLPAVIGGYIGNPNGNSGWIEGALAQGGRAGRWPDNALDLDGSGAVVENKFAELPLVGGWGRRPLELATLRLQNMVGVSIQNWGSLAPDVDKHPQVLTQLGGCVVVDEKGEVLYEFKDPGICAVANFDDVLAAL